MKTLPEYAENWRIAGAVPDQVVRACEAFIHDVTVHATHIMVAEGKRGRVTLSGEDITTAVSHINGAKHSTSHNTEEHPKIAKVGSQGQREQAEATLAEHDKLAEQAQNKRDQEAQIAVGKSCQREQARQIKAERQHAKVQEWVLKHLEDSGEVALSVQELLEKQGVEPDSTPVKSLAAPKVSTDKLMLGYV